MNASVFAKQMVFIMKIAIVTACHSSVARLTEKQIAADIDIDLACFDGKIYI